MFKKIVKNLKKFQLNTVVPQQKTELIHYLGKSSEVTRGRYGQATECRFVRARK